MLYRVIFCDEMGACGENFFETLQEARKAAGQWKREMGGYARIEKL